MIGLLSRFLLFHCRAKFYHSVPVISNLCAAGCELCVSSCELRVSSKGVLVVESETSAEQLTTVGTERMKRMVQIEITSEEAQMLMEILEAYLSDLRMEIADTEQMDFREGLKRREVFLKELIQRLKETG
jgi:hypothetical protein